MVLKTDGRQVSRVLEKLHLSQVNSGACQGSDGWVQDPGGKELISVNPTTGEPIAAVVQADQRTSSRMIEAAATAFQAWREIPAPRRGMLVRDLGQLLRDHQEALGELVSLEMGKILVEGEGEVQEMIDICDFAVGLSRQLYGITTQSERPRHRMFEQWHPLGPIGIITAFNFPVAVWSWNAAIAAVCGDSMVWKPSSTTPLCAVAVQHLCNQVSSDHGISGLFCLAVGPGATVGETLLNDRRIPLVSFTGSVRMGRHVAQTVASRLGRTLLELGGNNAIVVTRNADLDLATRAIVFGAAGTAGQRCTTTRRLIVEESVSDRLISQLVTAYGQIRVGDPTLDTTLMGPLVSESAVEEMSKALDKAVEQGGKVLFGGKRLPELGPCFVEPAIVLMKEQVPIVCEETFAPILYVISCTDLEQAIHIHNAVPQGLSGAIFTRDLLEAELFLSASGCDCGIANVNIGTSGAEIGGAFGGEKETGGGRESGSDAWKAYMRRQTNTVNWSSDLPLAQGIRFGD